MTKLHNNESADEYATIIIKIDSRTQVIRCRHDLQWIVQKRSSPDFNKGYWIGRSYHTTSESLLARYTDLEPRVGATFRKTAHSQLAIDDQADG